MANQEFELEVFEVDASLHLTGSIFRFCNEAKADGSSIEIDGETFTAYPVRAEGFTKNIQGRLPRPTLTLSNVKNTITTMLLSLSGLRGSRVTRRRFLLEREVLSEDLITVGDEHSDYLEYPPDIYFVGPYVENSLTVSFELTHPLDRGNLTLPRRRIINLL